MERSGQIQYLHSHRNTAGSDRNRGYTLTELMLALTVLVFLSGITVPLISTLVKVRKSSEVFYQDEIGLYQLQLELALHDIEEVNYESIVYHKTVIPSSCTSSMTSSFLSRAARISFTASVKPSLRLRTP